MRNLFILLFAALVVAIPMSATAQTGQTPPAWFTAPGTPLADGTGEIDSTLENVRAAVATTLAAVKDGTGEIDTTLENTRGAVKVLQDSLQSVNSYLNQIQIDTCSTPDGSATAWTAAAHRMFTVTGGVMIRAIYGVVVETLTESAGGADISLGVAGSTAALIAVTDPTAGTLAAGDVWTNATTGTIVPIGSPSLPMVVYNTDIDLLVAAQTINNGSITIYVVWSPLPAVPDATAVAGSLAKAVWD